MSWKDFSRMVRSGIEVESSGGREEMIEELLSDEETRRLLREEERTTSGELCVVSFLRPRRW